MYTIARDRHRRVVLGGIAVICSRQNEQSAIKSLIS